MRQLSSGLDNGWHHVSSHGTILFYVPANQDSTTNDLSETLFLTRRTVWGIVGDLRRAGMLRVRKEERRHHYTVNLDAPFRHPVLKGITLRQVLGELVRMARRDPTRSLWVYYSNAHAHQGVERPSATPGPRRRRGT